MKTPRADYTLEFKKEAVRLVQGGQRQSEGCLPGPVSSQTTEHPPRQFSIQPHTRLSGLSRDRCERERGGKAQSVPLCGRPRPPSYRVTPNNCK